MIKFILAFFFFVLIASIGRSEVKVNYTKLNNFTDTEKLKVQKTAKVIERVLNSQEFKDRVITFTYQNKLHFVDTTMTNQEVYETLMRGAEKAYMPIANGNMDIGLEQYFQRTSTIGYTTADSDVIHINKKFHDNYDEYEQAENLVHEWTHKLGFDHDKRWNVARDYSVPYGVGNIVTELAKNLKVNPNYLRPVVGSVDLPTEIKLPETPKEPVKECYRSWKTMFRLVCREL